MGRYFLDTSALVKRYHPEQGTDIVDAIFAEIGSSFVISRLGIVEATSALALKVRNGELPPDDYSVTRKKLLGEVAHGTLKVMLWSVTIETQRNSSIDMRCHVDCARSMHCN